MYPKLHFVCTGNIFRSRLAESYAKSLVSDALRPLITSSGVNANENVWGQTAWFTRQVAKDSGLLPYFSDHWTQTSPEILQSQDVIVFMTSWHYRFCQKHFNYSGTNHYVLDIPDITASMTDDELLAHARVVLILLKPYVARIVKSLYDR